MTESPPKRQRATRPVPAPSARGPAAGGAAAALDPAALTQAMRQLMEPLAALAIARGVPFITLEDLLKTAVVDAARSAHPSLPAHRLVSRISTATGINRREVTRITQTRDEAPAVRRSPATRVFTKWLADPSLTMGDGTAMALPRQGPAPSFEALAQSVTRDVHPRSLLDELCRLGLARLDGETVHLVGGAVFVPEGDAARMLGYLGSNVGDHLRAAVANVVSDKPPHFEQAVSADGLSPESLLAFEQIVRIQWKALLAATAPALQKMIDDDRAAGRADDGRVRLGLYSYSERPPFAAEPVAAAPKRKPGRPKKESTP